MDKLAMLRAIGAFLTDDFEFEGEPVDYAEVAGTDELVIAMSDGTEFKLKIIA